MTPPLKTHLLAHGVTFRTAWCGQVYVDPHADQVTTDRTRVTCRNCRRAARLDWVEGRLLGVEVNRGALALKGDATHAI